LEYVADKGRVADPGFGVIVNWMLLIEVVSLTLSVSWLKKGVAPEWH
jgi:hypothetical protein